MIKIYKTIFSFMVMIIIPIWLLIFTLIQEELNDYLLFLIPLWILTIVINNFFNKRKTTSEYGFSVEDYSKKLDMAKALQQALLSIKVPDIEGVNIAAECIPAQHLGGDFFTLSQSQSREFSGNSSQKGIVTYIDQKEDYISFSVGDVAGHGVSSALIMSLSMMLIQNLSNQGLTPSALLKSANNTLVKYIGNSHVGFVTLFIASFI